MAGQNPRIRNVVVKALKRLVGADALEITDDMNPIGDLGLASVDGVDFVLEIEDELGIKIPNDANPLVDDQRKKARTVGEIVKWIEKLPAAQEASHAQQS